MRAHAMNMITRRPALRDDVPASGPIHLSVTELNMLLGRRLYETDGIVPITPANKRFKGHYISEK